MRKLFIICICVMVFVLYVPYNEAYADYTVTIENAWLDITDKTAVANVTLSASMGNSADVYVAVFNYDDALMEVKHRTVNISDAISQNSSFNISYFDYKKGMYAVCFTWDKVQPIGKPIKFELPNLIEYGAYVFEAENIITANPRYTRLLSDSDASGGNSVYFTAHRWNTEEGTPVSDGTDDSLLTDVIIPEEKGGNYNLWIRYKLLPHAEGSFIWYRYADVMYARKFLDSIYDEYAWNCITLNLSEGRNVLAFSSGVPSYIDKFILTQNLDFVPEGVNDKPDYVNDTILEYEWSKIWDKPPVTPPEEHPRLYLTGDKIPEFKENFESGETASMYKKFKTYAYEELDCRLDTTKANNHNGVMLVKIMSRALVYVLGEETDSNHAKQTISYMRDYLDTVRTPSDTGDITRVRGDILVAAAIVYDWCYPVLTLEDKEYFKKQFIALAASKEIGWPPKAMSSVASHAGEQELFRDLLAAGIAIYDEYPLYYNMVAGRIFEEMVSAREWLRSSGRFEQGNDYGEGRAYSEMWADITFKRMGCDVSVYGDCTVIPLKWLIHSRMPYGAMMPSGDMYTLTRSDYKVYRRDYSLAFLIASNLYQDSQLKQEFIRRIKIAYVDEATQFFYMLFNDPDVTPKMSYDEPLAQYTKYPVSSILHKTSWQEGFDSDSAMCFMNMHEIYVGDHQNIYTGDFQIYYKGLLAMNTGTYNASTQHNEGYKRRSIAGNTMLCYDPNETFVPTWSNVIVPNDGGQRNPYVDENGKSKGDTVQNFNELMVDKNGIAQNKELTVSENVKHYIGPNAKTPLYSYISGELANAYTDKVESYKRSMVFADLANDTYPAAFVVYDKMKSKNSSFKKTWLMHSQQKPFVSGNTITIIRTDNDFDGKLVDNVLLPEFNSITVVGGENNEMFTVGNISMPPKENTIEGGKYRIELSPVEANQEDSFLNVMYVTSASGNTKILQSKKIETELFVGASIYDRVILFSKGDAVNTSFTLTVNSDFDKTYVLVCDVKEGNWKITSDNMTSVVMCKKGENAIFTELVNGTYVFEPTGDEADKITYSKLSKREIGDFFVWKYSENTDGNGTLNGNFLYQEKPVLLRGDIPFVPIELLGDFEASCTSSGNKITVAKGDNMGQFIVGTTAGVVNGNNVTLSETPFFQNKTVYLPVSALSDIVGYSFMYKPTANTLLVNPK